MILAYIDQVFLDSTSHGISLSLIRIDRKYDHNCTSLRDRQKNYDSRDRGRTHLAWISVIILTAQTHQTASNLDNDTHTVLRNILVRILSYIKCHVSYVTALKIYVQNENILIRWTKSEWVWWIETFRETDICYGQITRQRTHSKQ